MQLVFITAAGKRWSVPAFQYESEIAKALAIDPAATAALSCEACGGSGRRKQRAKRRPYIRFLRCARCDGTGTETRLR